MTHVEAVELTLERNQQIAAELARLLAPGAVVRADEPLAKRTTLRVGGPADIYVEPYHEEDLSQVLDFCHARGEKFFVLGRGSNLLVRDGGFRGVVISLSQARFNRIEIAGDRIWCGAGARLKQMVMEARRNSLSGVEFLEGIPGSVGGALRMNAGAMGGATFDVIESIRFMDHLGHVFEKPAREIPVEYRACSLFKSHIALDAVFRCAPASLQEIDQRIHTFSKKRWTTQPAAPSAGCIFKNPQTIGAGKLVDEIGLKGLRVGGAVVSQEHGNFIINDGTASAQDILRLIDQVKQRVREARQIELHTEVQIIGED
jgi:UDP-N-acetylenolpyruvoylglucosamine reductase